MEEGRREIRVFCDEKPGWQMGFSFLNEKKKWKNSSSTELSDK